MSKSQPKVKHVHSRTPVYVSELFQNSPRAYGVAFDKLKASLTITAGWALSPAFRAMAHFFLPEKINKINAQLAKLRHPDKDANPRHTPETICWALVAGEDSRFFVHPGFDVSAILRAAWQLVWFGRIQGASTIEQQLVRTITRDYRRTFSRKFTEIILAACVQEILSKREILDAYLRVAHFGWGMDGITRACRVLGYSLSKICPIEAASLIARLKYPEPRVRTANTVRLLERRTRNILRHRRGENRNSDSLSYSWKRNEAFPVQRGS